MARVSSGTPFVRQIARQLRLDPAERVKRMTPAWAAEGLDPIATLTELAG